MDPRGYESEVFGWEEIMSRGVVSSYSCGVLPYE